MSHARSSMLGFFLLSVLCSGFASDHLLGFDRVWVGMAVAFAFWCGIQHQRANEQ